MRSSPVLFRRAALTGSAAAAAGIASALPAPAASSDAVREVLALCREADRAIHIQASLPDGTPSHAAAEVEASRLELKIERLRVQIAAKPSKTWDDVAVLAVIGLYWHRGETGAWMREDWDQGEIGVREDWQDELIGAGERALPSVLLALLEVLGIRLDRFAHA
jgi:hypothetical protein